MFEEHSFRIGNRTLSTMENKLKHLIHIIAVNTLQQRRLTLRNQWKWISDCVFVSWWWLLIPHMLVISGSSHVDDKDIQISSVIIAMFSSIFLAKTWTYAHQQTDSSNSQEDESNQQVHFTHSFCHNQGLENWERFSCCYFESYKSLRGYS